MPRGHYGAVVFVVKRGTPKVNQLDVCLLHRSDVPFLKAGLTGDYTKTINMELNQQAIFSFRRVSYLQPHFTVRPQLNYSVKLVVLIKLLCEDSKYFIPRWTKKQKVTSRKKLRLRTNYFV